MPSVEQLYLDLMKKALTRTMFGEHSYVPLKRPTNCTSIAKEAAWAIYPVLKWTLERINLLIAKKIPNDQRQDEGGKDWPPDTDTLIGLTRLQNLQDCALDVIRRQVPGDFIETGVYRGGACIFMRAVLAAYQDTARTVWVADSFQGLPIPEKQYPQDRRNVSNDADSPSLDEVKANFARYGLLDGQVRFLPGWFKDTLPQAPIERLALLRLDGDMYSSTMDALQNLYSKVSPGGYVIVDDYVSHRNQCGRAVDEFRSIHGINEELQEIDWTGVFWKVRE